MADGDGQGGGGAAASPQQPISLKTVGPTGAAPASGPQIGTVTGVQAAYDPTPDQEKARANIAYRLLWTLIGIIVFLLIAGVAIAQDCYHSADCKSAKDTMSVLIQLVNVTFTPLVGLVGSVVGFYFGSKAGAGK